MNKFLLAATMCLFAASAMAQTPAADAAPAAQSSLTNGTQMQAELTKSLDAKKAKSGDEVTAKVIQDVKVNGSTLLQKGSKLVGHVTEAQGKTKEGECKLGVVFDKAIPKGGQEIAFNGVIISFSAPADNPTSSLGGGGMDRGASGGHGITANPMAGNTNPITGSGRDAYGNTQMPASTEGSSPNGNAAPGLSGMEGVAMSATPTGSVFHSASRNIKLDNNAQMVVQVVTRGAEK
jgi:hypothetical protein